MGNLGQVNHEDLVGDGLAQGDGKFHVGLLEFLGVEDAIHRDDARRGVGHLDADRALAGDGGDDTDADGSQTEGDVVLQVLDLGDAHALGRRDLVERDGRADGGADGTDLHAEVVEHLDDAVFVGLQLLLGGKARAGVAVILLEQAERGKLPRHEGLAGVDGRREGCRAGHGRPAGLLVALGHLDAHAHLLLAGSFFLVLRLRIVGGIQRLLVGVLARKVVVQKLHRLRLRVVKDLRILALGGTDNRILCRVVLPRVLVVVAVFLDRKLHLAREIVYGVEHLANDVDGLRGDVGHKRDGHDQENGDKARRAHHVLQPLADVCAMVAARIEHLLAPQGREKLGKGDAAPRHDDRHAEEPFQEVQPREGAHHPQAAKQQKGGDQKGRDAEAAPYKIIGGQRAQTAAVVGKLTIAVQQLPWTQAHEDALVDGTRLEVADHGDDRHQGQGGQGQSQHEVGRLVEYLVASDCVPESLRLSGGFLFSHIVVCSYSDGAASLGGEGLPALMCLIIWEMRGPKAPTSPFISAKVRKKEDNSAIDLKLFS